MDTVRNKFGEWISSVLKENPPLSPLVNELSACILVCGISIILYWIITKQGQHLSAIDTKNGGLVAEWKLTRKKLDVQNQLLLELSNEMRSNLQLEAEDLKAKTLDLQTKLTEIQAKNDLTNNKMEIDNAKHTEEIEKWHMKYRNLQNDYSECETELNMYKSCNVAKEIVKLYTQMENLSTNIDSMTKNISEQISIERRACCGDQLDEMNEEYKRMTAELESRNLVMPNMNFAILFDKFQKIRGENDTALKTSLRNVYHIEQDLKLSYRKMNELVKVVDEMKEAIETHFNAWYDLKQISMDKELTEEENVCEEAKTVFEEAKTFFNDMLKTSKLCCAPEEECSVTLPCKKVSSKNATFIGMRRKTYGRRKNWDDKREVDS